MTEEKLRDLTRVLNYQFQDLSLLRAALTHRSKGGFNNNERLEFLGDAILNFTIADILYRRFSKAREGDLTRMRALLVRGETLASIARDFSLGNYLQLGIGEKKSGGHARDSILSDALEAIIGAIYLDSNLEIVKQSILAWFEFRIENLTTKMPSKDPKTELQEYCQARKLTLPKYEVVGTKGGAHEPIFKVICTVPMLAEPVTGEANSRRKAEQMAAEAILKAIYLKCNSS